jgi:pimeloyl-ACP methyl ester carboxylesterase
MAPTVVLHAKDDTLPLYHNAEFAARTIPGAKLVSFERGGHIVVIVEQMAVRTAVRQHILNHAPVPRLDLVFGSNSMNS